MPRLCFVTTCMGRLRHLEQTLEKVADQPDSATVVVDYSCPDRCGDWVRANFPAVRLVRVPGMDRFNRSRAANRALEAVAEDWICFFDCDVEFHPGFATTVLPLLQPGHYYLPHPILDWGLCGTFVCARRDFERVGGFDEVYEGWGERDFDLYVALEDAGIRRETFPASLVHHLFHSEHSRVRFHETRQRHRAHSVNRIYRFVKRDLRQLTGSILPPADRRALYQRIADRTRAALDDGEPLDLVVRPPGCDYALRYELGGPGGHAGVRLGTLALRSESLNAAFRYLKSTGLRLPLDLEKAFHRRRLPYRRKLERTEVPLPPEARPPA